MLFDAIAQLNQKYAKQKGKKAVTHRRATKTTKTPLLPAKQTKKAGMRQLQYNNLTTLDRRSQLKQLVASPAK